MSIQGTSKKHPPTATARDCAQWHVCANVPFAILPASASACVLVKLATLMKTSSRVVTLMPVQVEIRSKGATQRKSSLTTHGTICRAERCHKVTPLIEHIIIMLHKAFHPMTMYSLIVQNQQLGSWSAMRSEDSRTHKSNASSPQRHISI